MAYDVVLRVMVCACAGDIVAVLSLSRTLLLHARAAAYASFLRIARTVTYTLARATYTFCTITFARF